MRQLEERLRYLRELDERRIAILESIRSQDKLDDQLEQQIMLADTKARLEDIYLPYKPKRRTKAQIAREAGHEPVADALIGDPTIDPAGYDAEQLDGARAILVERFAEDADLVGELRELMWTRGQLESAVRKARRPRAPSSRTTSSSPNRSRSCRRTGSSRCSAARRKRSSR